MKGIIKTYLPEKKYGFIKGDDGKDYFFHESEFTDKNQLGKICEDAFVNFNQKATPKGYKAQNCRLINPSDVLTYIVPDEFLTSRSNNIKGWDVIEQGQWMVDGSSRDSPEAAKKNVIGNAAQVGANALLNLEYYKTTGSEAGTGDGTHHFTIHNFRARVVTIAKRNSKGQYKAEDLCGLNARALSLKENLVEKTKQSEDKSKNKRIISWVVVLIIGVIVAVGIQNFVPLIITFVLGLIIPYTIEPTDYDSWLEYCGDT